MSRKKIAAGNWKMNKSLDDALSTAQEIGNAERPNDVLTILGSPYLYLNALTEITADMPGLEIAAQNAHQEEKGAYTGEISVTMLKSIGISYVILGHSERRQYFSEDDALIAKKLDLVIAHSMTPIFCCGEPLDIRKAGTHVEHVKSQISNSLFHLPATDMLKVVIAYEPIWAIGTGETASPEQAQEMHKAIRNMIDDKYGRDVAQSISILYGGSVKPGNAQELFAKEDVDGGLVGGASLKSEDFTQIIHSF